MTTQIRVEVDAKAIKSYLKKQRITPQMVMALAGYKEIGPAGFNRMLREGSVTQTVADVLTRIGAPGVF